MDRRAFISSFSVPPSSQKNEHASIGYSQTPSLAQYAGPWNRQTLYHLLRRTVVAPTLADIREAENLSMEELVDRLLVPATDLPNPPTFVRECLNTSAIYWNSGRVDINNTFFDELRRWWMLLMINGGLSIRERMTLFYHNHFAVNASLVQDSRYLYLQNQLFRRSALGDFKQLVRSVTVDKAMLLFLDGRENKSNYVNENYARELQELFTIGIADNDGNPNYTQKDVVELSKALTGWDWVGLGMDGDVVNNWLTGHNSADKTLYGETIAGSIDGGPELTQALDIIFSKEETARYVIRKLYRFFVYTDTTLTPVRPIPSEIEENIIAPLAAEFRQSQWQIASVLRTLFTSQHFYDPAVMAATIKSPVDLFVGAVRSTLVGPLTGQAADFAGQYIQGRSAELEQSLFYPPGVQGWQFYRSWISSTTLPKRHFYTDELLYGTKSTIIDRLSLILNGPIPRSGSWKINVLAFAKQFASFDDPDQLIDEIMEHLLAFPASESLRLRLRNELVGERDYEWPTLDDEVRAARLQAMLRYMMRSTNYQLM